MAPGRRLLILAGASIPLVFWGTLAICAAQFDGYRHLENMVSELGAAGTPTRAAFASGLLLCAILSVVFAIGIHLECRRRQVSSTPALVILVYAFSVAGAAIFPMPHRLHGVLGSPAILLLLSPVLAVVFWRKLSGLRYLVPLATISLVVMALGFLVFVPEVLDGQFGLKQRFFHAGWTIWFGYASLGFAGILERGRGERLGVDGAVGGR